MLLPLTSVLVLYPLFMRQVVQEAQGRTTQSELKCFHAPNSASWKTKALCAAAEFLLVVGRSYSICSVTQSHEPLCRYASSTADAHSRHPQTQGCLALPHPLKWSITPD